METLNSTAAAEHRRELLRRAEEQPRHNGQRPRTQVRRWVQLKHLYGSREERWARPVREDAACATC